jgi:hypothetical protein
MQPNRVRNWRYRIGRVSPPLRGGIVRSVLPPRAGHAMFGARARDGDVCAVSHVWALCDGFVVMRAGCQAHRAQQRGSRPLSSCSRASRTEHRRAEFTAASAACSSRHQLRLELTGRENIYLGGAILGMRREIQRRVPTNRRLCEVRTLSILGQTPQRHARAARFRRRRAISNRILLVDGFWR